MQARDADAITAMVTAAGGNPDEHRLPGCCVLLAYDGDAPVGIAAITTSVDTGQLSLLWVTEARRGRGIGATLIAAVRKAAHTRGAQRLYVSAAPGAESFLQKRGFERSDPHQTWLLDISRDGIIER